MIGAFLLLWITIVEPWLLKYAAFAPFGVISPALWMWSKSDLPLSFPNLTPFVDLAVWRYVGLVVCWVGVAKVIERLERIDGSVRERGFRD